MVFAGVPFLFYFLPLLLAAYYARGSRGWRNGVLLAGSLIFYAWGEGSYLALLLVSIGINHALAHRIAGAARKKTWLIAGVTANLALLGWFKYAGFLAAQAGLNPDFAPRLPLGISFFTFQAISYLIDVARKDAPPAKSLFDSALYIASFPQLIAGPIVRFSEVAEAIRGRQETVALFASGVRLFLLGLGQKVLLANLAAGPADSIFALPAGQLGPLTAWAGLGAYTLQIFFDFAGYSNMAIGLGLMMGFRFTRNFDFPYASASVTEFWRRWHMTLSRWFRDYLYIPLGGNRGGVARTMVNLWAVFLLCGLWHGAAWTFVLWGAWHGAFLSLERAGWAKLLARLPAPLPQAYLLLTVALAWVLFRAETIAHAGTYYAALFGQAGPDAAALAAHFPGSTGLWLLFAATLATPWPHRFIGWGWARLPALAARPTAMAGFVLLFVACAAFLAGGVYNPFIYFRF